MSARNKARKRALDILFMADVTGIDIASGLELASVRAEFEPNRASSWTYARAIVVGVVAKQSDIDRLIEINSQEWPLSRMPTVDRALLRIAIWEILYNSEVPSAVAISEAINFADELSTDASAGFIHGILSGIVQKTQNQ